MNSRLTGPSVVVVVGVGGGGGGGGKVVVMVVVEFPFDRSVVVDFFHVIGNDENDDFDDVNDDNDDDDDDDDALAVKNLFATDSRCFDKTNVMASLRNLKPSAKQQSFTVQSLNALLTKTFPSIQGCRTKEADVAKVCCFTYLAGVMICKMTGSS